MFHILYRTENLVNGKFYVGVHSAKVLVDAYLGSGQLLQRAIKKYGRASFIRRNIAVFATREAAYTAEELFLAPYLDDPLCYNIARGGRGNPDGLKRGLEARWSKYHAEGKTRYRTLRERGLVCTVRRKRATSPKTFTHVCSTCGVVFITARRRYHAKRFCSESCRARDRHAPRDYTCHNCGSSFIANHPRRRYCSHRCANQGTAEARRRSPS